MYCVKCSKFLTNGFFQRHLTLRFLYEVECSERIAYEKNNFVTFVFSLKL